MSKEVLLMDASDLRMLLDTVHKFGKNEIVPRIKAMEEAGKPDPELLSMIGELGLGEAVSEYGKYVYCKLIEALSYYHVSTVVTLSASWGLAGNAINIAGTQKQKEKWLYPIMSMDAIGAFCLTEADAGSDVANLRMRAEQEDGEWVLNGTKTFITNGGIADIFIVFATINKDLKQKGITAFIISADNKGISIGKHEDKMGIRGSDTTEVIFDNVVVPDEDRLGEVGDGFKIAMQTLNGGRVGLAAGCLGGIKNLLILAFEYANNRKQMGLSLTEFEMMQEKMVKMYAHSYLLEAGVYEAARAADAGEDIRNAAAVLKRCGAQWLCEAVDDTMQIFGGVGYMEEGPIALIYRDARINKIFEGTQEIQQLLHFKDRIGEFMRTEDLDIGFSDEFVASFANEELIQISQNMAQIKKPLIESLRQILVGEYAGKNLLFNQLPMKWVARTLEYMYFLKVGVEVAAFKERNNEDIDIEVTILKQYAAEALRYAQEMKDQIFSLDAIAANHKLFASLRELKGRVK